MTAWRDIPGNPNAFDELLELVCSGRAVGFVGAGASAGLYPLWPELIERLADAAVDAGLAKAAEKRTWCEAMDALMAARQIRRRLGEGPFAEQIRAIFGPSKGSDGKGYTPTHDALARLGLRAFVTTNYDQALTLACEQHPPKFGVHAFDWRHDDVARWLQGRSVSSRATKPGSPAGWW